MDIPNKDGKMTNSVLREDSVLTRYIVAVLSAWGAEIVTYPVDLAKTRITIQNEVAAAKQEGFKMEYHGLLATTMRIITREGPLKLWAGLTPMFQRHVVYAGCRLILYEKLRDLLSEEKGKMSLGKSVLCGMTTGALSQLISSPTDLVKVQMQAEGRRVLQGHPRQYKGSLDVYKVIYKKAGILGFWRGAIPNMQRSAFVNVGDLTAYDYTKRILVNSYGMEDGLLLHSTAAWVAGFVASVLGNPADLIKTRLMNQPLGPDGRGTIYKGSIDCIRQTVANEGILALYKGFFSMWLRLGPWAMVNWLIFENIMVALGGKTF